MSARDVIRQIEALSPEEQREVKEYFLLQEEGATYQPVRRMALEDACIASERVFAEHSELFRKLAQ